LSTSSLFIIHIADIWVIYKYYRFLHFLNKDMQYLNAFKRI